MFGVVPMKCSEHPEVEATHRCYECEVGWCDDCGEWRDSPAGEIRLCPGCGSRTFTRRSAESDPMPDPRLPTERYRSRETDDRSFFERVSEAFVYPFNGPGPLILVVHALLAAVAVVALSLVQPYPVFLIVPLAVGGYVFGYWMKAAHTSAVGIEEPPDLPVWKDFFASSLRPLFQYAALWAVCYGPGVALVWADASPLAYGAALLAGSGLYPMCFLGLSLNQSVVGIHPIRAIVSIAKVPVQYLVALVVIAATATALASLPIGEGFVDNTAVLLVGQMVFLYLGLYLLLVEARIMGVLYHANRRRLAWFEEDE